MCRLFFILVAFLLIVIFVLTTQSLIGDMGCCTYAQQGLNSRVKTTAQETFPPDTLGEVNWTNNDKLVISIETDSTTSNRDSLGVYIRPATTILETVNSSWSTVSTDFIPVKDYSHYDYSLDVSAKDVNQLHSKVIDYDKNKREINSEFIFGGTDGTFKEKFTNTFLPEMGTKYVKLQMWVRPSLKNSSYVINNIKMVQSGPSLLISNNSSKAQIPELMIERIFGLNKTIPNSFLGPNIAFLDANTILLLDDVNGKVSQIINSQMSNVPLLDLNSYSPDGLIGIAATKNQNGSTYVFLYLNEAPIKYGSDVDSQEEAEKIKRTFGYEREGDRLYRYELVSNKLVSPKLLLSIPDRTTNITQEIHHGGEVLIGPDNAVYVVIGDIDGQEHTDTRTKAQNYKNGTEPDGRAGILRVDQDGKAVGKGILGDTYPLDLYYAYGIRNSFGMDFDPVTGNLWNTENGPDYGDEINLVEPGFNSGSKEVYGFWKPQGEKKGEYYLESDLENFNGKGIYSEPEFTWIKTVGPTAIKFFNSDKFGVEYKNDMFVADINNGNIYHFDLTEDRTELMLKGPLKDRIANGSEELDDVIFAKGFDGIADLQVGPDGYLYILSSYNIYRIRPMDS